MGFAIFLNFLRPVRYPRRYIPPRAKSNCYPRGGIVMPKGVLPGGLCFLG
jgi:hypothetical protein